MAHRLLLDETIWLEEMQQEGNKVKLVCLAWCSAVEGLNPKNLKDISLVTTYRLRNREAASPKNSFKVTANHITQFESYYEIMFDLDLNKVCKDQYGNNEVLDFHTIYKKKKTRLSGPVWQNPAVYAHQGYYFFPYSTKKYYNISLAVMRQEAQKKALIEDVKPAAETLKIHIFVSTLNFGISADNKIIALAKLLEEQGFMVFLTALKVNPTVKMLDVDLSVNMDYIDSYTFKSCTTEEDNVFVKNERYIGSQTRNLLTHYLKDLETDIIYLPSLESNIYDVFVAHTQDQTVLIVGDLDLNRFMQGRENPDFWRQTEDVQNHYFRYGVQSFDAVHIVDPSAQAALEKIKPPMILTMPVSFAQIEDDLDLEHIMERRTILATGSFVEETKLEDIIEAFFRVVQNGKAYDRWQLLIIGAGEMKNNFIGQSLVTGLSSRIKIKDPYGDDYHDALKDVAIYMGTGADEIISGSLIEAMALGCGVLAYDSRPECNIILHHGETAWLRPHDNIEQLAAGLQYMMSLFESYDPALQQMVIKGRQQAEVFSDKVVGALWHAALHDLLMAKRNHRLPDRPKRLFVDVNHSKI